MEEEINPKEARKIIQENSDILSDLLKAMAQINRLTILSLLLEGEKEFHRFKEKLDLSKTALANHISVLLDNNLIVKIERGSYEISEDGKDFMLSLASSYRKSQTHSLRLRKELWEKYLPNNKKDGKMGYKVYKIEQPAHYKGGWLSYVASITGILQSFNQKVDPIDVAGYTGYAFFFNMTEGIIDPSGPTSIKEMNSFHEGIQTFGWSIREFYKPLSRKVEDLPIKNSYIRELFKSVKEGLERSNRPVVLWGIPIPEYGIVNGYESDAYIVSTLRSTDPEKRFGPDTNIKYDEIVSPGRLQALFFESRIGISDVHISDLRALKKALKMKNIHQEGSGYISGPDAFKEWSKVLQSELETVSYHGNSYVSECICETLYYATQFISRLAQRYIQSSQGPLLKNAFDEFKSAKNLIVKFEKLFPFGFDGDLNWEKRIRGADILNRIIPHVSSAFECLKSAVERWE